MRAVQRGIHRLFVADDVSVTLDADSGTEEIVIPAADWANVYVGAFLLYRSNASGTSAADGAVSRIHEIDEGTFTVTVEPALAVAAATGDELLLGLTYWLRDGAVRYENPKVSTPVRDLKDDPTRRAVALVYGERPRRNVALETWDLTWEFKAASPSTHHAEGCAERARWLLHGKTADLQGYVNGVKVGGVVTTSVDRSQREDGYEQYSFTMRHEATGLN